MHAPAAPCRPLHGPARLLALAGVVLLALAGALRAEGEAPGRFDYYLLALSWSPGWCATEGASQGGAYQGGAGQEGGQCAPGAGIGWTLHGLWPQNEDGSNPSFCRSRAGAGVRPDPSRRQTAAMADIMGSAGLAWYQWRKHGRCSGLSAGTYFGAARLAFERLQRPPAFEGLAQDLRLPASVVEEAFLQANPALTPQMLTVTCKAGRIQEVRLCLDRRLEPRPCGAGADRDCRMGDALMEAVP